MSSVTAVSRKEKKKKKGTQFESESGNTARTAPVALDLNIFVLCAKVPCVGFPLSAIFLRSKGERG